MFLFKYYRPDFFFDKAIRYNELYFSSTEQLNDPNDLKTSYFFEDNIPFWQALLESESSSGIKQLNVLLDLKDQNLAKELCILFLGTSIDGTIEGLEFIFNRYDQEITTILINYIRNISTIEMDLPADENKSIPMLLSLCKNGIKERILKGLRVGVYSVSFSTEALQPMMWAHYAGGFKGCVVIYNAPNNTIPLKRNIYSKDYYNFQVDSVIYQDHEKHIPILKSALSNDNAIRETLLVKNTFWHYESEKRIFLTKRYISHGFSKFNLVTSDISERIYHHDPSTIAGVIFGPNFNIEKMDSIELLLRDNRRHIPCAPFYLFETELMSNGTIKVVNGKQVESSFQSGETGAISHKELPKLLSKLKINLS